MIEPFVHTELLDPKDAGIIRMLGGMSELLSGMKVQYEHCAEEKHQYQLQLNTQQVVADNMVADGKQNEWVAILNVLYEAGLAKGSKKEFMQRMAIALGCPKIADYSAQLYKIKLTYKYDEIFKRLTEVAQQEKIA